jgi:spore maturation protein A
MAAAVVYSMLCGNAAATVNAGINAAQESVTTVIAIAGIMCLWSGIMKIADKAGIPALLSKLLSPVLHRLFPRLGANSPAMRAITMNITANMLGMGNAATPPGLQAMEELDKQNEIPETASDEMCIFTVLNTASFQLIPTTIISLRAAAGSVNPSEIILPVWITSALSLTAAVTAAKLILSAGRRKC